jgi:hypothetical protein
MQCNTDRRGALKGLGAGLMTAGLIAAGSAQAEVDPVLAPPSAHNLRDSPPHLQLCRGAATSRPCR